QGEEWGGLRGFYFFPFLPLPLAKALFTETPHDMTAQAGEDVEMACSFRGTGAPSYSLEIQWWYVRNHKDWADKQTWASNQVMLLMSECPTWSDPRVLQVVKVVGSNISHKLRLSRVKPEDEGTYECRVIDASDGRARQHKVKAFLRVEAPGGTGHPQDTQPQGSEPGSGHAHHQPPSPGLSGAIGGPVPLPESGPTAHPAHRPPCPPLPLPPTGSVSSPAPW
uniref:V-set and transmembrane domain-containing protein 2-like protein n=1 Tax=Melopsittacus undulatus TaxID=13146 RepID=A0A8C6N7W0_MELUD